MGEIDQGRRAYEASVRSGDTCGSCAHDVALVRDGDIEAARKVAAAVMHVATLAPERLVEVYDGLAEGWRGVAPSAPAVTGAPGPSVEIPDGFFDGLWSMVDDPNLGKDPAEITVRTAQLAFTLPEEFFSRVAAFAHRYPGVTEASSKGLPPRFTLEALEDCPPESLGGHLRSLVVDQGFDLEVLDRDALGLKDLESPLDYLNTRILQCHDVWHEVAGYETTGLHEIAISGFQMAQFGHHYSSMFLAMTFTTTAFLAPVEGMGLLLDTVLEAYVHGRETPPLLGVVWEDIWDRSLDEIRDTVGCSTYDSPYDPALLELIRNG